MLLKKRLAAFLAGAMICSPPIHKVEAFALTPNNNTAANIIKYTNSTPIDYQSNIKSSSRAGTPLFNIQRRAFALPEDPAFFAASQNEPMLEDWAGIQFDGTDGGIYEISYYVRNTTNIIHVTHQLRTDATGLHQVITTVHNSGHHLLNYGFPKYAPNYPDSNNLGPYDQLPSNYTKYSLYNSNLSRYDEYTLPDGYKDDLTNDGLPSIDKGEPDQEDDPNTAQNETIKDDIFIQDSAEQISIGGKSIIGKIVQEVDVNSKFLADFGNTIKLIGPGNDFNFRYIFEKLGTGEFRFHLTNSGVKSGSIVNYKVIELNALNEDPQNPVRSENLKILKQLNNFDGVPTHYMIDPDDPGLKLDPPQPTTLINDEEIESPQTAGERPGFDIMFDHPLDLDSRFTAEDNIATPDVDELATSNGYDKYQEVLMTEGEYLKGKFSISSYDKDNIQFFFNFSTDPDNPSIITVHNNPNELATKSYVAPTEEEAKNGKIAGHHLIKVVQDDIFKLEIDDGQTTLGQEDASGADADAITKEFIEWSSLSNSELMNIVEIEIIDDENPYNPVENRFINQKYSKTGDFYTYMEYRVERVSLTDAILTYTPYKGLSDSTKYRVYDNKEASEDNLVGIGYGYISDSVPVPMLSDGEQGYLIEVVISDQTILLSQYLKYNAAIDTNIKPPTPLIDEIKNIYVVPPDHPTEPTQAIGFDISFTAPKNTEDNQQLDQFVNDGTLYYELLMYEDKETPADGRVFSKIFKVDREVVTEGEGEIQITGYAGEIGDTNTYNQSSETFTVEDVLIKQNHGEFNWNHLDNTAFKNDEYLTAANYPAPPAETGDLSYPQWDVGKTYYFTIRAVYDRDPGEEGTTSTLTFSNESNPVAITFTNKNEILPIVTIITDEPVIIVDPPNPADIYKANQRINFNVVNLETFIDYMLDPIDWTYGYEDIYDSDDIIDKYGRTYEVFLYQKDEPTLQNFEDARVISATDIDIVVPKQSLDVNLSNYLTSLRDGKVLRLDFDGYDNILPSYSWPKIEYKGLDQNQTYYVQIRTRVDSGAPDVLPKYSTFSKIHTFTTHLTPKPPSPEEQKPPTPADFWVEDQNNNTSVVLRWDPPNYEPNDDQPMYYELLRTESTRLDDDILDSSLSLENVLMKDPSLLGFATGGHFTDGDNRVYSVEYNGAEFITKLLSSTLFSDLLKLEDETLTPNTIYYYYLRTIVDVDGTLVGSEWISQPVTTTPVDPPAQLKVEKTKAYDYLPTDEVVVSFIAPIPTDAVVPDDYDFEISIKGEGDSDFSFANAGKYSAERLTPNDDAPTPPEGYQYYVYHLRGFESSTRYDIKVRIIDYNTNVAADEENPRSLYSNSVSYQTEVDDEDEQDKSRLEEYLSKFDRLVLELRGSQYWTLLETEDTGIYKFKEAYLKDAFANEKFDLITNENFTTVEYYFPGKSFADGHAATLAATLGDFSINIRPDTIASYLDEISDAKVDTNSNKIEDYYIKVALYTRELDKVDGEEPLTDELNFELAVVYLDNEDIYLEVDILDNLNDLIDDGRLSVEEDLKEALAGDIVEDDELLEIVEAEIANISTRYQDKAFENIQSAMIRDKKVKELKPSVLITSDIDTSDATAFIYDKGWHETYAFQMIDGWATELSEPSAVVFGGTKEEIGSAIDIDSVDQDFIKRYDLDIIFGTKLGPGDTASKEQLYTAIASILGANKFTNPATFLVQAGFRDVNPVNLTGSITQEDAIYIVMQLYEKLFFTNVSSIMISNRQAISNIGAFKPNYRQHISAAIELGFVEPVNNQLYPTMPLDPEDLLNMLIKVMAR